MARTKTKRAGSAVVVQPKAAAPIVVVPSSSPARRRRSSGVSRRRSGGVSRRRKGRFHAPQYNLQNVMLGLAAGGAIVGYLEKHFGSSIPNVPFVGKKGAIALAVLFLKPKNAWLQDAGKAAAAISGYQLGSEGKVTGPGDGRLL